MALAPEAPYVVAGMMARGNGSVVQLVNEPRDLQARFSVLRSGILLEAMNKEF